MQTLGKIITSLIAFVVFLTSLAVGFAAYLYYWASQPSNLSGIEQRIEVEKGITLASLAEKLENAELVSSGVRFKLWTKVFSSFPKFKAGTYMIETPITPAQLASRFMEGSSYRDVAYEITIPEGFSLKSVIERYVGAGIGTKAEFERLATDSEFLASLGIGAESIEGFLYPATYPFYEKPTETQVFKEMVSTFWKKLPLGYEALAASRGITLYQAIIFASLIEAETKYQDEKNLIAEVIWNRLNMGMPLGIDAAVIYGIKEFDGNLTRNHLVDSANDYNLRIKKGLPPTPINSPTISSLKALLSPSEQGYLYYVLSPGGNSRHTFTKNLAEHNVAVSKFLGKN